MRHKYRPGDECYFQPVGESSHMAGVLLISERVDTDADDPVYLGYYLVDGDVGAEQVAFEQELRLRERA